MLRNRGGADNSYGLKSGWGEAEQNCKKPCIKSWTYQDVLISAIANNEGIQSIYVFVAGLNI